MVYLKSTLLAIALLFAGAEIEKGLNVGDTAVDFNLKGVDGKTISLSSDQSAQGYILVFTCNTCPYSVMYEDRIIALHEKYAKAGYPVIAIQPNDPIRSPGDSFDNMIQRAEEKGFSFPYLMDETQETTKVYGATNTPHAYVLNKQSDNSFRIEYIGAIDNNSRNAEAADKHYVQNAIDGLLTNKAIETTSTKAIGCTIKWAK